MTKVKSTLLAFFTIFALVGCTQSVSAEVAMSDKSRDTSPDIEAGLMELLVDGNNQFALELYQQMGNDGGNLFLSPYSISAALAMTWAGARGGTENEMAQTLRYQLAQEALHAAFNQLDMELTSRGEGAEGKDGEGFKLNIANAIWGQKNFKFLDGFLDTLAVNYGAGLRLLDFADYPEESRITINDWVSAQTEGRIRDLIKQGLISSATRLVLTNAIYFNAAWQYPFDEDETTQGSFYLADGSPVSVELMHHSRQFGYAEGENYQAVELKYDGGELSMVVLLPKENNLSGFVNSLDSADLEGILDRLNSANVNLTMPKFEYESEFSLKAALEAMGMSQAFSDLADFSGMTGGKDLFIGDVVHKAFVSLDEAGTEAAAATAVIMDLTSMPAQPVDVTIDHGCTYLIKDNLTGTILFMGSLANPA